MINGGPPGLLVDLPGPPSCERRLHRKGNRRRRGSCRRGRRKAEEREPSPTVHEPPRVKPEHQTFIEDELWWPEETEERRRALFIGGQLESAGAEGEGGCLREAIDHSLSAAAGPLGPRRPNPVGTHNKLY